MDSTTSLMDQRPPFIKAEDGMLLTSHEADYMVERLKIFDIEEVGSKKWLTQHENIEKLNLQAHYNTMTHSNDFVMGALISHEKLGVLIHELLVIEIWMENVFPRMMKNLTDETSTIPLSLTIYHEGSIANLLEVILYHRDAWEAMTPDAMLELVDFCYRKLVYLNTQGKEDAKFKDKSAKEFIDMSIQDEFVEKVANTRFQVAMCGLTILRYLTDYINLLPLSIMARLVDEHDVIMGLVPLIESSPWKRQRRKGDKLLIEKYNEGKWAQVTKEDLFKVTKSDAQVWLSLYNLIIEPNCRSRYKYNDYRKDQVLKLQKHLNDMLVNQIPILKDLQWALEEISLNIKPKIEDKNLSSLVLEQVPALREKLLSRRNWDHLAKTQLIMTFSKSNSSYSNIQEMLRMFQFGESMEEPKCASCGSLACQRCSRCKYEWYCGKSCQKKMWPTHKKICDILKG